MKFIKIVFILSVIFLFSAVAFGQSQIKNKPVQTSESNLQSVKSSAAYAEVLLRKTEVAAELESLLVEYTEEFPKIKELRFEATVLEKDLGRILAVNPSDAGKLTQALGKLMVRKAELETDLWALKNKYNDEHPDVKRAKRKVEYYESAIKDILQLK